MEDIAIVDKVEDYDKDFVDSLSNKENQLFDQFMEETNLNKKESLTALIRFIKFPGTYEKFSLMYDMDISILLEKCTDFLNSHSDINEKDEITILVSKDLTNALVITSSFNPDDIWLE